MALGIEHDRLFSILQLRQENPLVPVVGDRRGPVCLDEGIVRCQSISLEEGKVGLIDHQIRARLHSSYLLAFPGTSRQPLEQCTQFTRVTLQRERSSSLGR